MKIEICTASRKSVDNAIKGGTKRVELCSCLEVGGLTPSMEDVKYCVEKGLETRVLIRPREGDFLYNNDEYQQILADIEKCKQIGATAVVVGFLHEDGTIDEVRTKECVEKARPMEVTFHRAFDEASECNLQKLIDCGCDKLLTSGQKPSALEGKEVIKKLVEESEGRIAIIAAAGVVPGNVKEIIDYTGVTEVHGSCKKRAMDGSVETSADEVQKLIRNANKEENEIL